MLQQRNSNIIKIDTTVQLVKLTRTVYSLEIRI